MKVLIVGRSGQVATELARRAPGGTSVLQLGRPEFDLTDRALCENTIRTTDAEVIINAAAYTNVDGAERDEATAMAVNAEAPATMAKAAAERGIPFLHLSTDYVYDGAGKMPFSPQSSTGPLNAYGRTKLMGDLGVVSAGGPHVVLRTSWVFSAHGSNFVKTMLRLGGAQGAKRSHNKESERDMLSIVADQVGGPTPAASIADALWRIVQRFADGGPALFGHLSGIYHFSGTPDTSWAGFAQEIFRMAKLECRVEEIPTSAYRTAARRPLNSRLNCDSLHRNFDIARPDWRPRLRDVLQELGAVE